MIDTSPSWVQVLLAVALIVVVPAGLRSFQWSHPRSEQMRTMAAKTARYAGVVAAGAFLVEQGTVSGVLTAPWLLVAGLVSISALVQFLKVRSFQPIDMMRMAACAYLTFGAGWLVLSRLGIRPLDFSNAVVELTAVHFHFAGFAAPLIAAAAVSWQKARSRSVAALSTAGLGAVAAMPVIALGTTYSTVLAAAGSVLLGVSLILVAVVTLFAIVPSMQAGIPRVLLFASSASVLAGMLLGMQYALGQWLGTPALDIRWMARVHGTLNALGFSLGGLLGWKLANERQQT